jgi:quercetin dioxygenase-like cupin family protein
MCIQCAGKAVVRSADEGEAFWFDNGLMTLKARSDETGGSISVVDAVLPAGKATPLHVHPDFEESFYVIEGVIMLHVDGVDHRVTAGATYTVRRGTPHAFAVVSDGAHLLVLMTPGGGERFFIEVGEPAQRRELPPPAARDMQKFMEAAERTGMLVVLGPPPFDLPGGDRTETVKKA